MCYNVPTKLRRCGQYEEGYCFSADCTFTVFFFVFDSATACTCTSTDTKTGTSSSACTSTNAGTNADTSACQFRIGFKSWRIRSQIRLLEAENQRLTSELAIVTAALQNTRGIVNSSIYTNTLSGLNDVKGKASEITFFAEGLPDLPSLPPGLTVEAIDDAVQKAKKLREILKTLPPPPPLAPSWWEDLDDMKTAFINMTEWMESLRELPQFLSTSGSLDELRSRVEGYLVDIQNTVSDAEGVMEQVRDVATP